MTTPHYPSALSKCCKAEVITRQVYSIGGAICNYKACKACTRPCDLSAGEGEMGTDISARNSVLPPPAVQYSEMQKLLEGVITDHDFSEIFHKCPVCIFCGLDMQCLSDKNNVCEERLNKILSYIRTLEKEIKCLKS